MERHLARRHTGPARAAGAADAHGHARGVGCRMGGKWKWEFVRRGISPPLPALPCPALPLPALPCSALYPFFPLFFFFFALLFLWDLGGGWPMGVAVGRGLGTAGSSPPEGGGKGGESEAGGKMVRGPWLTICCRGGFRLLLDGSDSRALAGFAEGACRGGGGRGMGNGTRGRPRR